MATAAVATTSGEREQGEADGVSTQRPVVQSRHQRREEATEPARRADDARDRADTLCRHHAGDQGEHGSRSSHAQNVTAKPIVRRRARPRRGAAGPVAGPHDPAVVAGARREGISDD